MEDYKEEFRPVKGYEGLYEINYLGEVRSLPRQDHNGNTVEGQVLNTTKDGKQVRLINFGQIRSYTIVYLLEAVFGKHKIKEEVFKDPKLKKYWVYNYSNGKRLPSVARYVICKIGHRYLCVAGQYTPLTITFDTEWFNFREEEVV